MNAIYRWLARRLPMTLVKLCAIRALETYAVTSDPVTPSYDSDELKETAKLIRLWAGNAAIDF